MNERLQKIIAAMVAKYASGTVQLTDQEIADAPPVRMSIHPLQMTIRLDKPRTKAQQS